MSAGAGIVSADYIVPATKGGIISIGRAKCPAPQAADELASKTYVDTAVSGSAAVTAFESFDLPMYRSGGIGDVIATPRCTVTSTGGAAELYVPRFSFVAPEGAIAIQSSNYAIPINFTAAYPTTICTFVSDSTAHQDWVPFLVQMGLNRGIVIYPLSGSLVSGDTYSVQPFSMPFILEAFMTVPVTFSNGSDSSFSLSGFALNFGRQSHFTFNTLSFTGNAAAPTASTALPAAILPINTVTCYAIASVGDEGTKSPVSMHVGADGTLTFYNPSAIDGLFLLGTRYIIAPTCFTWITAATDGAHV